MEKHIHFGSHLLQDTPTEKCIGNNVFIGPGVTMSGRICVEDDVFIGSGSVILPDINIGKGACIGAGSIVTKDVNSHSLVYGNPAKPRK